MLPQINAICKCTFTLLLSFYIFLTSILRAILRLLNDDKRYQRIGENCNKFHFAFARLEQRGLAEKVEKGFTNRKPSSYKEADQTATNHAHPPTKPRANPNATAPQRGLFPNLLPSSRKERYQFKGLSHPAGKDRRVATTQTHIPLVSDEGKASISL